MVVVHDQEHVRMAFFGMVHTSQPLEKRTVLDQLHLTLVAWNG